MTTEKPTREDVTKALNSFVSLFGYPKTIMDKTATPEQLATMYLENLDGLCREAFLAGAKHAIHHSRFFPTIADIMVGARGWCEQNHKNLNGKPVMCL